MFVSIIKKNNLTSAILNQNTPNPRIINLSCLSSPFDPRYMYKILHINNKKIAKFNLNNKIYIRGGGSCNYDLLLNEWAVKTIIDLKKEWWFKDMQITLILYGKDDNNNHCSVTLYSNALTRDLL